MTYPSSKALAEIVQLCLAYVFENVLNTVAETRKCSLPAFSLPSVFSEFFNLNPFPNKPWFLHVCSTSFFKTLPFSSNLKLSSANSLYTQSLLIFVHKTPVVESHPTTREIKDLLWLRSTLTGNTVYFYMSSSLIYILKINRRSFKHSIR